MGTMWLVLALLGTQFCVSLAVFPFVHQKCSAGEVLFGREDLPASIDGAIFYQDPFTCSGNIFKWEFNAVASGSFYACVFSVTGGVYRLKSFNKIIVEAPGLQVFELPLPARIRVDNGDVIGYMHDAENDPVLSLVEDVPGAYYLPFNKFHKEGGVVDAKIGTEVYFENGQSSRGQISLRANVKGPSDSLRLFTDDISDSERKGRAETHENHVWGTICDRWWNKTGWPMTFCRSLGYPEAKDVAYVKDLVPEKHPIITKAPDSMPSHLKSPNLCAPSYATQIPNCPVHSRGFCDHDLDVYLECEPDFRCYDMRRYKKDRCWFTSCVPQVWRWGCWGSICDNRGIYYMVRGEGAWADKYCEAIGAGRVASVEFVGPEDDILYDFPIGEVNIYCPEYLRFEDCDPIVDDEPCEQGEDSGVMRITCVQC